MTGRSILWQETTELIGQLNRGAARMGELLLCRHHQQGIPGARQLHSDAVARRWLRCKFKVRRRRGGTYPLSHLYGHFGLVRLTALGRDEPWAKA